MEEKILAILENANDELLTYTGDNMVADDIIDSFELITLVGRLENTFDIEIDAADITEENFGNKDRLIAYVKSLVK